MKVLASALSVFLLGSLLVSNDAEARCWWNGYNHCLYYHHGWYGGGWHHGWYHNRYWYR